MSYLFILKRFEVWLLFGVVVVLLVFAFQPLEEEIVAGVEVAEDIPTGIVIGIADGDMEPEAAVEPEGFQITAVDVEPADVGQIIKLTLLARAKSEGPVFLNEDTLKASTEGGVPIPHFFAPFQKPQSVISNEDSLVTVKLWMAESAEAIWLDFQGDRAKAELSEES